MHRTNIRIEHQCENAKTGTWNISSATSLPFGVVPFIKGREDIEAILKHQLSLPDMQPIEISGYGVNNILRRAVSIEAELEQAGIEDSGYSQMTKLHPCLVSFPADLIWLAREEEVRRLVSGLSEELVVSDFRLTSIDAKQVAWEIGKRLSGSARDYMFWRKLLEKDPVTNQTFSRLLIEYAISVANRSRATSMAGIVPSVDQKIPGSADLMHHYNIAYAAALGDRLDQGMRTPHYQYSIALNSSVIEADTWSPVLETVTRLARAALVADIFDGIHLTIRGMDRISLSSGRVNVVLLLINRLATITSEHHLPLWWSRPSLAGLAGLDEGCAFTSYRLNLDPGDVYAGGGGRVPIERQYGKVLNPVMRQIWNKNQVEAALNGPDRGMPDIGYSVQSPSPFALSSAKKYRIDFSKPYNTDAFNYLSSDWKLSVRNGETRPGSQYLQSFEAPHNQWGRL